MAKIVIMDDNRSTSALLKKALEREDHQVGLVANWQGLSANIEDSTIVKLQGRSSPPGNF